MTVSAVVRSAVSKMLEEAGLLRFNPPMPTPLPELVMQD